MTSNCTTVGGCSMTGCTAMTDATVTTATVTTAAMSNAQAVSCAAVSAVQEPATMTATMDVSTGVDATVPWNATKEGGNDHES